MKSKSIFLFICFLFGCTLSLFAQNMAVKSFKALPTDMTASSLQGKRIDQNGEVAALIKITTTQTGFIFEGGTLGIVDSRQETGEVWVWVPHSSRKITIKHPQLGVLREYRYPIEIESERTYEMVLVTGNVETIVSPGVTQQFLVFKVTPKDAMVTVDEVPWPVVDGVAQKLVDFGKYSYRVEASGYLTGAGKVEVNDPDNKVTVEVALKPAFGYLKIEGDMEILSHASVYIDKANGMDALGKAKSLSSGQHQVRIVHPKYKPFEMNVVIEESETYILNADLSANYSNVTLAVDADAEILVNGERKGVRTWTGDLEAGNYRIECRMKNHRSSIMQKTVTENMSGQTIQLDAPVPIMGRLVVSSTPPDAELFIDGQRAGETPMQINSILIGEHSVRMEKKGYVPLTKTITIEEGKTFTMEERLTSDGGKETHSEQGETIAKPVEADSLVRHPIVDFATLNFAYSFEPQPSYGFCIGSLGKIGWFFTAMSNFSFDAMKADLTCDSEGLVDGNYVDFTGSSCSTRISAMAGLVVGLGGPVYIRLGAGYGTRVKSWYTDSAGLVKAGDDSRTGVDATMGVQFAAPRWTISLDAVTTNFKSLELKLGVGMRFN